MMPCKIAAEHKYLIRFKRVDVFGSVFLQSLLMSSILQKIPKSPDKIQLFLGLGSMTPMRLRTILETLTKMIYCVFIALTIIFIQASHDSTGASYAAPAVNINLVVIIGKDRVYIFH